MKPEPCKHCHFGEKITKVPEISNFS